MDSRVVNKKIKKEIWSFLKNEGFSKFTSRNAWRYNQHTIEVVNFQSFNSYLAELVGCTTYSFTVNLGIYFTCIPDRFPNYPVKEKDGFLLPYECECHLRKVLLKSLPQPELARKSIWYINESGDNIEIAMNDVRQMLISDGLKWFQKYSQVDVVLETLLNEEEDLNGTHGFGRKNSPIRNYTGGYIAYILQKYDLASGLLKKAINSGCFKSVNERLQQDYERIKDRWPIISLSDNMVSRR